MNLLSKNALIFGTAVSFSLLGMLDGSKTQIPNIFEPRVIGPVREVYQGWTYGCDKTGPKIYNFDQQKVEQREIGESPKYPLIGHDSLEHYLVEGEEYEFTRTKHDFFRDKIVSIKPAEDDEYAMAKKEAEK